MGERGPWRRSTSAPRWATTALAVALVTVGTLAARAAVASPAKAVRYE